MKFCIQHAGNIIDSYGNASTSTLFLDARGRRGEWGLQPRASGHKGISGQQNVDWTNAVSHSVYGRRQNTQNGQHDSQVH